MRRVLFVHNGPLFRDAHGRLYGMHFTNQIVERYRYLGQQVTFLMREQRLDGDPAGYSRIDAEDFTFVAVPNVVGPVARARYRRVANQRISRAVAAADIVVARLPSATASLAVDWARRLNTPCLTECVGCNWDALWNYNWKGKLGAGWYSWQQRRRIRAAPYVIYVTQEFLQRRYPTLGQCAAISNVELPLSEEGVLERRLARIEALAADSRPLHLATVGNVAVPYKAQGDVIRAVAELRKSGVEVVYHLVGEGDPSRLVRLARRLGLESQVVIHGAMPHSRVFDFLEAMDLYLQPSRQEGLPRALIEAMSRGLPSLGSRAGGIPELLPQARTFRAGDLGAIARLIAQLRSPELQREDARRNVQRAQDFDPRHLGQKRRAFFDAFLAAEGLA